jgi:preprotein translocase subunit SecG
MQVLNIFHVLIAIALVAFVLIQKGQGATAGAAFGSGASGTVFGARGAGNFLTRSTWVLAALFCAISLTMAVMVSRMSAPEDDLGVISAVDVAPAVEESQQPAEISITSDEPVVTDVPSFDAVGGDVPSLETDAVTEDLPAAGSEEDSSGSGEGGS